ncbi:MAG: DUF2298 domain-containing protein [Chloroflexota bacterium]|nr:DUF2298 domain-containing protein [Chloroflexota bacterium]
MRKTAITALFMAIILVFAGVLRFTGHNWDDFSYSHPDERFLSILLLPNIGGRNEFTHDQGNFPSQSILVRSGQQGLQEFSDLSAVFGIRIGAVSETFSAQVAAWMASDNFVSSYGQIAQALEALRASQLDAVIVDAGLGPNFAGLSVAVTVDSLQLQSLRCRHLYPRSNGAGNYFDARCSPLNPHQAGHGFYAYGTFPLLLAHYAGEFVRGATEAGLPLFDWQGGHLVWRGLSTLFDLLTIVVIFALGSRLHGRWVGLIAAALYAAAPLAIQKSHYATTNAIAASLVTLALFFAVAVQQRGRLSSYLLFGLACGAAVASRMNLAPLAGIVVFAAIVQAAPCFDPGLKRQERLQILAYHFFGLILAGFASFLAFRLLNPYAFMGPDFLGITPNDRWLENARSASFGVSGVQDSPPNWQWLSRASYFYPLKDMALWAMGPPLALLAWFGWGWSAYRIARMRKAALNNLLLVVWVGAYFIWLNQLWPMTMRYFLPLYSGLAVLAGWAIVQLIHYARRGERDFVATRALLSILGVLFGAVGAYQLSIGMQGTQDATAISAAVIGLILLLTALLPLPRASRAGALALFAIGFTAIWGLMFGNVYRHQTTLVQASRYLFKHVPGDFAMRIDGSEESAPLVNVAVANTGYSSANLPEGLFKGVTHYREAAARNTVFTTPASGSITTVFAPHLGDPLDDPEPERLEIRVYPEGDNQLLAEAVLEANLARRDHPLGDSYEIPFARPWQAEAGKRYVFEVLAAEGSGDIIGSGSVVVTEGSWDNTVTGVLTCQLPEDLALVDRPASGLARSEDCRGKYAFSALVNSYDQIMSFPVDNQSKYENILHTLEVGDYLTIASNRFYDTEPRNRMRWSLTTHYYEKLFAGELGYERVAVFDEPYQLGPWRVSDQHLPIFDSPAWLNEIEADEAFHVYDHPAVFVFRKTEDYSSAKVKAILSSASLRQRGELSRDFNSADRLGVIYWTSMEADAIPTALTFPPADYETQTAGGTWSERFFSDSIANSNQALGSLFWYVALLVIGFVTFPIVFALFPSLADGGYGISKLAGVLLLAWFAWAAATLKFPLWSQGGLLALLALLALFSANMAYRRRLSLRQFLRGNWRRLAWMELLAILAFVLMLVIRLTNPDLWHPYKGGEKPMDFAYLNGVLRSTTFPPIDPWFAGGFINYYYFGYVLVGVPSLLLGIVPSFAYNLMIPTIFSLTGAGAFSAAFNILSRWKMSLRDNEGSGGKGARRLGSPWTAGLLAMLMCILLGNLDTIRVAGNGIAALGGYQKPEGLEAFLVDEYREARGQAPDENMRERLRGRATQSSLIDNLRYEIHSSASLLGGLARGVGLAISGEPIPMGYDRWYWGPSRVLAETPGVRGNAITEMPFFTFLYGDLHAHMINMPLILMTVAFVFNELTQVGRERRSARERFLALALGAMAVGVMQASNTWDWPSMTLLATAGLGYCWQLRWRDTFRWDIDLRFYAILTGALLVAIGLVTLLHSQYGTGIGAPAASLAEALAIIRRVLLACIALIAVWIAIRHFTVRASAIDLLGRVGGFLALNLAFALPYTTWQASSYTSLDLWHGGKTPLWAYFDIHGLFLFLVTSLLIWESGHWMRSTRVADLRGRGALLRKAGAGVILVLLISLAMFAAHYQAALIALPMLVWIAFLFFRPGQSRALQFVLVLIGLALSLTLGVEIVVIGGDIGRQNTVFKFYIQVWLLLSVAGGVAMSCLLSASVNWSQRLRVPWFAACIGLFAIAGAYPILATRARSLDRMAPHLPLTLDGLDYMKESTHWESAPDKSESAILDLAVDHALIRWMQENIAGSPVIMEGRRFPSEYQWNGRISIATGLPSVLGWNWHQRQQRTFDPLPTWVEQRERNVRAFYHTGDIDEAVDILYHYDVKYIVRSGLEELHSSPGGLAKFERMVSDGLLSIAFAIEGGAIYQVHDDAILQYLEERFT